MDYNTNRPSLKLPEYGRNVQKMVDYALTIADRDERQQCAETIIKVMGNIFPQQKGSTDFVRMLWDHLAFISDYKLDVDSPYPITVLSEEKQEHPHLDYPKQQIDYRHYGHTLEQMIRALSSVYTLFVVDVEPFTTAQYSEYAISELEEKGYSIEKASRQAPKVIYMAVSLLMETPFERIMDAAEYAKESLTQSDFLKLKGLKKVDPLGYGYLVKADRLLSKYRT